MKTETQTPNKLITCQVNGEFITYNIVKPCILFIEPEYDFDSDDDSCDDKFALIILPDSMPESKRDAFCDDLSLLTDGYTSASIYLWDFLGCDECEVIGNWISNQSGWCINDWNITNMIDLSK